MAEIDNQDKAYQLILEHIDGFSTEKIEPHMVEHIEPQADITADKFSSYKNIKNNFLNMGLKYSN